ncbi:FGGY-family carbohydrate kinase [Rubrimonas cliftonensis]|uniref:FGGY-family pentulose kinase n=1 Tax=Rubrimonas cliftonensis TaxID=89524 RepID=A0A1H4BS53_9RHOB|nr:FGGY-family carbohydrate kinase [Rubrimonas cliftonensis]SEA50951.1 hypothetical protein SAMN05444370_10619 [Rubrimonas cliftonensis]
MEKLLIGVDVGTASARAGLFSAAGALLGADERQIPVRRTGPDGFEQDAGAVWRAACAAVRGALDEAGAPGGAVVGLAFAATASLTLRDADGAPLPLDGGQPVEDRPCWDTLLWLDHRAMAEAAEMSAADPALAALCGGAVSPEMQGPKALWLKRRRPEVWARTGMLLDLCDFLGWRATGSTARSACAVACKWPWTGGWRDALLDDVGLGDLRARAGLPPQGVAPGTDLGPLTPRAARELGLSPAARVGAGLIDAHAAALGMLGRAPEAGLALIAGTSSCVMGLRRDARAGPGLWGPCPDAVLPGLSVIEGGQSATGALLDHLIGRFGGRPADDRAHAEITARVRALRAEKGPALAADLHVLPSFHGARAPVAAPAALGAICGLALDDLTGEGGFDALCRLYWRACVALALELREIVEALAGAPAACTTLHMAGGHARSPLLSGLYAEAIGCALAAHDAREPALRGCAAVAAVAAGLSPRLAEAAAVFASDAPVAPAAPALARTWDRDSAALRLMRAQRAALAAL